MLPLIAVLLAAACGGGDGDGGSGNGASAPIKSELVSPAEFPVTLAFAPDGRLFYTEKGGNVRVISADGVLQPEPFARIENIAHGVEWGLIGLTFDPEFEANRYVYVYYTEAVRPAPDSVAKPVVLRFVDEDSRGTEPTVILDDLPETDPVRNVGAHVGGNLMIGPDGFLYVSIGDMQVDDDAQDLRTARGSIIRVDRSDGSAAPDNPFVDDPSADPRVWAYGLRNPFEFTFHPETGRLYAADNGPYKCDRLVIVEAGENYGWPDMTAFCGGNGPPTTPLYLYGLPGVKGSENNSGVGPTGLLFVTGDRYPSLGDSGDSLLACEWNTGFMRRIVLGGSDYDQLLEADEVVTEDCRLDIAISPDAVIYYANEKEIRRLVPQ